MVVKELAELRRLMEPRAASPVPGVEDYARWAIAGGPTLWPVSGDATTRAGSIVHRHRCPLLSQGGGIRRRGVAGGWLRRAPEAKP